MPAQRVTTASAHGRRGQYQDGARQTLLKKIMGRRLPQSEEPLPWFQFMVPPRRVMVLPRGHSWWPRGRVMQWPRGRVMQWPRGHSWWPRRVMVRPRRVMVRPGRVMQWPRGMRWRRQAALIRY